MDNKIVDVSDLRVWFSGENGDLNAVDHVSFSVYEGEILGIVGESGCGKSMTALAILGLLPRNAKVNTNHLVFDGEDISQKGKKYIQNLRGDRISMIFQEPMTSLNPVLKIGRQLTEVLIVHRGMSKEDAYKESLIMLKRVGIAMPERCMNSYPYEMSGGMRQRIMIAMALLCNPKLLIADEPTTALDVTIQAQILELLMRLRDDNGMSIILITHDLGVIAETSSRVVVMYAGEIVEEARVKDLFAQPLHPYTVGLMGSIPKLERTQKRLNVIEGVVPALAEMPRGCKFNPRCNRASEKCRCEKPPTVNLTGDHKVKCWLYEDMLRQEGDLRNE